MNHQTEMKIDPSAAPLVRYVLTLGVLLILTGITVAVSFLPIRDPWHSTIALLIAGAKASVVAVIFMHLSTSKPLARIFAVAGAFWLLIMLGLTFADYATRHWSV